MGRFETKLLGTALWVSLLVGGAHAASLYAVSLSPTDSAREVAMAIPGAQRWLGLGNTVIVEASGEPGRGRAFRPLSVPAGSALTLVLSKHATAPLPEPLDGVVLARHSGFTLAALSAGSRRDVLDPHIELRPVPWNRTISESLTGVVAKGRPNRNVETLLASITATGIRADIQTLVDFKSRHTLSATYKDAVTWTEAQFAAAGYATRRQTFSISGRTAENVVAELPGQEGEDVYVVGAHLDSVNFSGGVQNAPGADDNGSGAAGVLTIARALSGTKPRGTIRFVLFGGEEQGLIGSKAFVQSLSAAERAHIKGVLIMDMTGFRKNAAGVTLERTEISRPLSDVAADITARYTSLKIERSFEAWGSDHVPFLEAGIPALLTIELDYPVNGNDHSPRDTMEIIDADQAATIARANLAILATLNGLGAPER